MRQIKNEEREQGSGWRTRRFGTGKGRLAHSLGGRPLPQLSPVVVGAQTLLKAPDCAPASVAEQLAREPELSVRLLKICQVACGGLRHELKDLSQATHVVGRSALEGLLLCAAVADALPPKPSSDVDVWVASALRAVTASSLAQLLHPVTQSESFAAAFMQDMSVPLLAEAHGEAYRELLAESAQGDRGLSTLEREAFGWDHAHVAGWMCQAWGAPPSLSDAVGSHHESCPETPASVQLAALLRGLHDPYGQAEITEILETKHGILAGDAGLLLEDARAQSGDVAALFPS